MKLFESNSDDGDAAAQPGQGDPTFTFSKPHFVQVTERPGSVPHPWRNVNATRLSLLSSKARDFRFNLQFHLPVLHPGPFICNLRFERDGSK